MNHAMNKEAGRGKSFIELLKLFFTGRRRGKVEAKGSGFRGGAGYSDIKLREEVMEWIRRGKLKDSVQRSHLKGEGRYRTKAGKKFGEEFKEPQPKIVTNTTTGTGKNKKTTKTTQQDPDVVHTEELPSYYRQADRNKYENIARWAPLAGILGTGTAGTVAGTAYLTSDTVSDAVDGALGKEKPKKPRDIPKGTLSKGELAAVGGLGAGGLSHLYGRLKNKPNLMRDLLIGGAGAVAVPTISELWGKNASMDKEARIQAMLEITENHKPERVQ